MTFTRLTSLGELRDNLSEPDKRILDQLILNAQCTVDRNRIQAQMVALQEELNNLNNNTYSVNSVSANFESPTNEFENVSVGNIAKVYLRNVIEEGNLPNSEIERLRSKEYSKEIFDINYPLLSENRFDSRGYARYYKKPVIINGVKYYICAQWLERNRGYLIAWINTHI